MSRRKFLIIFVGMCLLLVGIIVLPSIIRHSLLPKNSTLTLFTIYNQDNTDHEVTVKLFDSKNTPIFNESYILAPDEIITSQLSVGLETGAYIEVTLDNNITETETFYEDFDIATLYIVVYPNDQLEISIGVP